MFAVAPESPHAELKPYFVIDSVYTNYANFVSLFSVNLLSHFERP